MGILSWFKKKKTDGGASGLQLDIVATSTEPIDATTAQKLTDAAAKLRGSSHVLIPPPMPAGRGSEPTGIKVAAAFSAPGLAPITSQSDPNALGSVRRYFVHMAAANMQRYDRNQVQNWQGVSVERFFMSITGTRPTINHSGIECSATVGTIDDAFASFQWD